MFNLFLPSFELDFVGLDNCVVRITEMCHFFFLFSVCPVHPEWSPLSVSDFPLALRNVAFIGKNGTNHAYVSGIDSRSVRPSV